MSLQSRSLKVCFCLYGAVIYRLQLAAIRGFQQS